MLRRQATTALVPTICSRWNLRFRRAMEKLPFSQSARKAAALNGRSKNQCSCKNAEYWQIIFTATF